MQNGDTVMVHPHGSPSQARPATVLMIGQNERAIAVGFTDRPPFAIDKRGGMAIHDDGYIVLMATRSQIDGKPWGPWIEIFGNGHFEIGVLVPA